MAAYSDAWKAGERACFNYLLTLLDATEGKDGFLAAIPEGTVNVWSFALDGGPDAVLARGCGAYKPASWEMDAIFNAAFANREDAINVVGLIMESLPAGKNHGAKGDVAARPIPYVQTLQVTRPPSVVSQWARLANSNQPHLVTLVTWQLKAVVDLTE